MSVVAYAAAAVAVVGFLLTAARYAWRARVLHSLRPCDRPEPLGLAGAAWAFAAECTASMFAMLLLPAGWIRSGAPDANASPGAVILIHDWGHNAGAFWLLRRRLRRRGWNPVVSTRHPALQTDIQAIADQLSILVDQVAASQPRQIVLLGHGFGGLVARFYVRQRRAPRVRRICTLGTPHKGSLLPSIFGPMHGILQPRGPLLSRLEAGDRTPQQFDVIALYSTFDSTVLPPANAEYTGAFNIRLDNVGHDGMLFSPKVFTLIEENLAAPLS